MSYYEVLEQIDGEDKANKEEAAELLAKQQQDHKALVE